MGGVDEGRGREGGEGEVRRRWRAEGGGCKVEGK